MALIPLFVVEVLGQDAAFAGTAFAVFGAANVVMLLVSGKLSDLWGRKPIVLTGLAVSAVGTVWVGYTESVPAFLVATVVAGLGSGLLMPSQQATVADIIGSKARGGTVLATFQMALDLGAIIGPVVAGMLADQVSFAVAFAMAGGLSVAALLAWLPTRETLPRDGWVTSTHPTPKEAVSVELPGK
jgi:MFS family permease